LRTGPGTRSAKRSGSQSSWATSVSPGRNATMTRFRCRSRPSVQELCRTAPYARRATDFDPCRTSRRGTCRTRIISAIGKTGRTELHAAPSATESLALFAITAAALLSVRSGASKISSVGGRATAAGYGEFELPEHGSADQSASSMRSIASLEGTPREIRVGQRQDAVQERSLRALL
jgi:hypothetical protein